MEIIRINISGIREIRFLDNMGDIETAIIQAVAVSSKGRLYGVGEWQMKPEHLRKLNELLREVACDIAKEL